MVIFIYKCCLNNLLLAGAKDPLASSTEQGRPTTYNV